MSSEVPFAPNVVPPSPEAANLAAYADIPVSLYTGIPEIGLSRHRCGQCHGEVAVAGWCGRRSVIGPQVSMTRARAALAVWKP